MKKDPKAGIKQGDLFRKIKKLEYRIEKDRLRLKKIWAKKRSFSDPSLIRANRRLIKKCIRLYDYKEAYRAILRKIR